MTDGLFEKAKGQRHMKELKGSWMSHGTAWGTIHFWLIYPQELYVLENNIVDIKPDVEFKLI